VVEHLPSKCEALVLAPLFTRRRKGGGKGRKEGRKEGRRKEEKKEREPVSSVSC
jgi:hypothetical protein